MDADDNYYARDRNYCAVRIPQSDGNVKLERAFFRANCLRTRPANSNRTRCYEFASMPWVQARLALLSAPSVVMRNL